MSRARYGQSDWMKKVITVFIISLYMHDIRSHTYDPYWDASKSHTP